MCAVTVATSLTLVLNVISSKLEVGYAIAHRHLQSANKNYKYSAPLLADLLVSPVSRDYVRHFRPATCEVIIFTLAEAG